MRLRLNVAQAVILEDMILEELDRLLLGGMPQRGRFDDVKELRALLADLRRQMCERDDEAREGSRDE